MFKLMTIALLSSTIALGPASLGSKEIVEDRQPITTDNVKRATYDDENYTITLTANELNNYTWHNFNDYLLNTFNNDLYIDDICSDFYYNALTFNVVIGQYILDNDYAYFSLKYEDNPQLQYWIFFNSDEEAGDFNFHYIDDLENDTFVYDFIFVVNNNYYASFKQAIELDIETNATTPTPTTSLFDNIYDYFNDKVFDSEYLNDYEMEIMGHTTSMRHYLCLTATIIFITLIVIFCVGFIVMLVKFVANMLINLGR